MLRSTHLVNNAPAVLNTLKELAQALGDNENFSSTVVASIATKAPLDSPLFTGTVSVTVMERYSVLKYHHIPHRPTSTQLKHPGFIIMITKYQTPQPTP